MSRRPKPHHLKLLAGTDRPDRKAAPTPPLPALDGAPKPPKWLPNTHAVAEWHRLAPILRANALLTKGNVQLLAHLAALHGRVVAAYERGETPSASHIGRLRNLYGDLGLLGIRLPPPPREPDAPANRFAKFRRRPDAAKAR